MARQDLEMCMELHQSSEAPRKTWWYFEVIRILLIVGRISRSQEASIRYTERGPGETDGSFFFTKVKIFLLIQAFKRERATGMEKGCSRCHDALRRHLQLRCMPTKQPDLLSTAVYE